MSAPRRASGFTLIEVLVALAIVAFGMAAVLASITSAADNAFFMRDKTLAVWVATNQISAVRLKGQMPKKGKSEGEVEDFAGRKWVWKQEVQPLEAPGLMRIDVSVRPVEAGESKSAALAKKGSWYATETGVMGNAVDLGPADTTDWYPQPQAPDGEDGDHDTQGDHH